MSNGERDAEIMGPITHGMHAVFIPLYKSGYKHESNMVWVNATEIATVDPSARTMTIRCGQTLFFDADVNPFDRSTIDPIRK